MRSTIPRAGSAKTTLAVHLAVAAEQAGERVAIADTDEQGSAATWERTTRGRRDRVAVDEQCLRRKRGQGEVVALTVPLSRAQRERMHTLGLQGSMRLQELAIDVIAGKFAKRGLDF